MKLLAAILLASALALAPAADAKPHAKHHSKKSASFRKAKKATARADKLSAAGPVVGQLWPVSTPGPLPGQQPPNGLCRVLYVAPDGSLELFDCR